MHVSPWDGNRGRVSERGSWDNVKGLCIGPGSGFVETSRGAVVVAIEVVAGSCAIAVEGAAGERRDVSLCSSVAGGDALSSLSVHSMGILLASSTYWLAVSNDSGDPTCSNVLIDDTGMLLDPTGLSALSLLHVLLVDCLLVVGRSKVCLWGGTKLAIGDEMTGAKVAG